MFLGTEGDRDVNQQLGFGMSTRLGNVLSQGKRSRSRRFLYALLTVPLILSTPGFGSQRSAPRRSATLVPAIMGKLFRREPVSPGPVAFKLMLPRSVHWSIDADPFGTMRTPKIAPAKPWRVTSASTEYLNLDTASHRHPDMAYRIRWLHFSLTVSGFGAGYQNLIVKSPSGSRVTLTQYTAIPTLKKIKVGDTYKVVYRVPIRLYAPVNPLLRKGHFTVFRVQTWVDGRTHVRVVEHLGRTTRTMSLAWATYVPFRPPYVTQRVHVSSLPPKTFRIHQLFAARLPLIARADGFAVTKIGLAWLQGQSLAVHLWPWRATHPVVVVKAWPWLEFNDNTGGMPWVAGSVVPLLWRSGGDGNRPLWGLAWNLASGRHRLLQIFGDRTVTPRDNLFGNPPGVFGQIVRLPKGFTGLVADGHLVLGRWHRNYVVYNLNTKRSTAALNPALPSSSNAETAWPIDWEGWGPSWVIAPNPRDLPSSEAEPVTIESAWGKPHDVTVSLPAGDTISVGSSFLVREDPTKHIFWIAWKSRHGILVWHNAGSYHGSLSLMDGGVVWTTLHHTWIWRAPRTPGY